MICNGKETIVDEKEYKYEKISYFKDGFYKTKREGYGSYGVINKEGKMIIPPTYSEISDVNEGVFKVGDEKPGTGLTSEMDWLLINQNGKVITPRHCIKVNDFHNGLAFINYNLIIKKMELSWDSPETFSYPNEERNISCYIDNQGNQYYYINDKDYYFSNALKANDDNTLFLNINKALELDPGFKMAYYLLGEAYFKKEHYNDAIKCFSKVIDLDHLCEHALYKRAQALVKRNSIDSAINDFSEVIRLKPSFVKTYVLRGDLFNEEGLYEKAISDYYSAIKIYPKYFSESNNIYHRYEEYYNAFDVNPYIINLHYKCEKAYKKMKLYDEEINELNKIIELKPNDSYAYLLRGNAYINKKQYDNAINDYTRAIDFDKNYMAAYFNRGLANYTKMSYADAMKDFNITIELDPENAEAYFFRGNIYYLNRIYDKALKNYSKAIEIKPDEAEYFYMRGLVYKDLKLHRQANLDFKKACELGHKEACWGDLINDN